MAIDSKRIKVSELDFDQIKENLKNYLRGQSEFSDYDFEGSGLSVLLDVLAYNTHYSALYNNLAVNEMFLDSASKRASVVSRAKELGYTPNSAKAAKALVNIVISNPTSQATTLILAKNTPFSTAVDGTNYYFYNVDDHIATLTNGVYTFPNVELIEGKILSFKYTVADGQKYIIPNANVDMSTLSVRVQESSTSDSFTFFTPAVSLVDMTSTTKAYYTKEIDGGLFEVIFGDGIVSAGLTNGNVVHLDYFVCNANIPNGARSFNYNGNSISGGTVTVSVVSIAAGGAQAETIDSIKYNAPRLYTAQNRAVTPDDYKALIYASSPEIQSVSVWGGEDNDPPVYGKTFICAKPYEGTKLTSQQKSNIISSVLASKSVVSIIPEIVDPEYINIALNVNVYYNDRETTKTANDIKTSVISQIFAYDDSDLQRFDSVFRYSKLSRLIDTCDPAITNNITKVILRRKIAPRYNVSAEYTINIINPIYTENIAQGAVSSTGFFILGSDEIHFIEDDGIGNIVLYYEGPAAVTTGGTVSTKIIVDPQIGTVDYANGIINIKNLTITATADIDFEVSIEPTSNDVVSAYTQIAQIARDHLTVNVIADKTANGDLRAGKNYTFSASR